MNYKNLIIFVVVIGIIFAISISYLVISIPTDQQTKAKNHPLVVNCIPGYEPVPTIEIGNYTHIFDLRTCTWNEP